ncbi:MAG: site-specific DNA-methyltransferase [Brevundimonas sp.]
MLTEVLSEGAATPALPPSLALKIEYLPIADLAPLSRKLKIHKKKDVAALAEAIKLFGFVVPILVDHAGRIVSGNGRLDAARSLGMTEVPCIRLSHLDEDKLRVFRIAENQLGQLAGWDTEALGLELQDLSNIDLGFSLEVTGFTSARIDALIIEGDGGGENADSLPDRPKEPVSQLGDLWLLGDHRLYCGDATSPASMDAVLQGEQVRAIFTDPPYNVAVAGHITSSGQHDEFVMASGEMSQDEFTLFLTKVLERSRDTLVPGGLCYVCMDHTHVPETLAAANAAGLERVNLIVWAKTAGGMGSFYRSRHELIFLFRKPGASHLNRVELGKHGRNRTNVWDYEGVNGFGAKKAKAREMHPTVKPMALVRDALLDCTDRGDVVLDLFSGSGTTLIAAEQSRRRGRATELDPRYVDVGVIRWQDYTGQEARLASTGQTFREVRETRLQEAQEVVALPSPAASTEARVRTRTRPATSVALAA